MKKVVFICLVGALALGACKKQKPVIVDSSVTVRNTIQIAADPMDGGTGGEEFPIGPFFGAEAGDYDKTATISADDPEFVAYLEGLYTIDLSKDEINFELVAAADSPIYSSFFRTIEAGTFDRYYFNFADGHNIASGTSDNSSVSLEVVSDTEIKVIITEGFDFNPGTKFKIELEK